jgi:hypothetical protein
MTNAAQAPETPSEQRERERRQRSRSVAIALALAAMSLLFYAATIVRMGGNVVNRPLAIIGSMVR